MRKKGTLSHMNTSIATILNGIATINQKLGVISTVSTKSTPESAVVYFSHDENLNLYFTTRSTSRKYKNIVENPNVSFVIYTENPPQTIQIEGVATRITDPAEQAKLFSEVVTLANSTSAQPPIDQIGESEIAFIKVSATWARLGNFEIERTGELFTEVLKQ